MGEIKLGDKGAAPGTTTKVVASKTATTSIPTSVTGVWWQDWITAPLKLDWTIVRNTAAFKKLTYGEQLLHELEQAFGSSARPTHFAVRSHAASIGRQADFDLIDTELRERGLQIQVAWCAIDDKYVKHWVEKIALFRSKEVPFLQLNSMDAAPRKASVELAELEKDLKAADKRLGEIKAELAEQALKVPKTAYEETLKGNKVQQLTNEQQSLRKKAQTLRVDRDAARRRLDVVEATGRYSLWSYGGDKDFTGVPKPDLKAFTAELLELDYIKKPEKPTEVDTDDKRRLRRFLVETYVRYFDREGAPNAVGTWDNTFTFGAGCNATGGAGRELLQEFAVPRLRRLRPGRDKAISKAHEYLNKCGIAVRPIDPPGMGVNDVRVLHVEGDGEVTAYRVMNRYVPPPAAVATRWGGTLAAKVMANLSQMYETIAADVAAQERAEALKIWENWLAFDYVRHQPTLIRAFAALGYLKELPDDPLKYTEDYGVAHALAELGMSVLFDASIGKFPLIQLIRRSSLLTFLHHILAWWAGRDPTPAMLWALARGHVRSRHKKLRQERKDDDDFHQNLIEQKGHPLTPLGAPPPDPKSKKPEPLPGGVDSEDEDDFLRVRSFEVDTSDKGQFEFARSAWIFSVRRMNLIHGAGYDKPKPDKNGLIPKGTPKPRNAYQALLWSIACKMWWEFCYDFALEFDPSITQPAYMPEGDVHKVHAALQGVLGKEKGLTRYTFPLEHYDDAVKRVMRQMLMEEPWRWDPEYKEVDGYQPNVDLLVDDGMVTEDKRASGARAKLRKAATLEVDELYVVEEITEQHLALARTMVFGSVSPFRSPFVIAGRYVVTKKADDDERGVGELMQSGLPSLTEQFKGDLK